MFAIVFPAWIVYYIIGIEIRQQKLCIKSTKLQLFITLVICYIIAVGESFILKQAGIDASVQVSQLRLSNMLFGIASCFLVGKLITDKANTKNKSKIFYLFTWLGDRSYGIFYSHYILIILLNQIIPEETWLKINLPIVQIIQVSFVLILVVIIIEITKKAFGEKRMRHWLGF